MKNIKPLILFSLTVLFMLSCSQEFPDILTSPDQLIEVKVDLQNKLQYAVSLNKDTIINNSMISLSLQDGTTLEKFILLDAEESSVNEHWERVWGKRKIVTNAYNELLLHLKEQNSGILVDLYFRAYNNGLFMFPLNKTINNITQF